MASRRPGSLVVAARSRAPPAGPVGWPTSAT